MKKTRHIPQSIKRDRVLHKLVMERSILLQKYHAYIRRRNPYHPNRAEIEKDRTRKRKVIAKSLHELEPEIMYRLGWRIKHPEIYTPPTVARDKDPLDRSTFSTYDRLRQSWIRYRPLPPSVIFRKGFNKNDPKHKSRGRPAVAQQIMDLEWKWLSALHEVVVGLPLPPRRIIHPSRYRP